MTKGSSSCFGQPTACKHYLTVGAIFRDEASYLKEWIEFHRMVGVEHFILYNNSSTDNYLKILSPYLQTGIVELIDWPSTPAEYLDAQKRAYNHCIRTNVGVTFWLALIDIDEFIVPVDSEDMIFHLSQYDNERYVGAIQVNWQLYGTSFLPTLPKDKLMVESLVWKAPWNYEAEDRPDNTVFKSIVRPHAIEFYRIHEGDFKENCYALPKRKLKLFQQEVQIDHLRINHYWTRAEDFFYEVKINRRMTYHRDDSYIKVMTQKLIDLNHVQDATMFRFVHSLQERVDCPEVYQKF
jgi:glycosyl transferase family 92